VTGQALLACYPFSPEQPAHRVLSPAQRAQSGGLSVRSEEYRTDAEGLACLAARDYRDGRVRDAWVTDDARATRALLGEKEVFRNLEAQATETHFARVRAGRVESRETSSLHLDVLRDMKRINSHIAAAAYPVLERHGKLLSSRLRRDSDAEHLSDQRLD
jgi:hypothetical protein